MSRTATAPRLRAPTMSERDLQNAILREAKRWGWLTFHVGDSRRQLPNGVFVGDVQARGFPDLVLVQRHTGRIIFRELKSATGKLTAGQAEWLDALKAVGMDAGVWDPACWPDRIMQTLMGVR